jgi:hypothetical protein
MAIKYTIKTQNKLQITALQYTVPKNLTPRRDSNLAHFLAMYRLYNGKCILGILIIISPHHLRYHQNTLAYPQDLGM